MQNKSLGDNFENFHFDQLSEGELKIVTSEVLRIFSLKEATYKALNPIINQYVAFKDVEIELLDNGIASVKIVGTLGGLCPSEFNDNYSFSAYFANAEGHWISVIVARKRTEKI